MKKALAIIKKWLSDWVAKEKALDNYINEQRQW
jgi:hypothetical protein